MLVVRLSENVIRTGCVCPARPAMIRFRFRDDDGVGDRGTYESSKAWIGTRLKGGNIPAQGIALGTNLDGSTSHGTTEKHPADRWRARAPQTPLGRAAFAAPPN